MRLHRSGYSSHPGKVYLSPQGQPSIAEKLGAYYQETGRPVAEHPSSGSLTRPQAEKKAVEKSSFTFTDQASFDLGIAGLINAGDMMKVWALFQKSRRGDLSPQSTGNAVVPIQWSVQVLEKLADFHCQTILSQQISTKTQNDSALNTLLDFANTNSIKLGVGTLVNCLRVCGKRNSEVLQKSIFRLANTIGIEQELLKKCADE